MLRTGSARFRATGLPGWQIRQDEAGVLLRAVVPRGIMIGPLLAPLLVIGGLAVGINKGATVNNLNLSPFVEKLCVHFSLPLVSLNV